MPVNTFLVRHPAGICLFDCGQTSRAAQPGHLPQWHPFLRLARFELEPEDEVGSQLLRSGLEPGAVRWVVLSHMHTDHVGGVSPFASAEILVTRTEWELATGLRGRLRGYLPQHWPTGVEPSLVDFSGPPIGPFAGSFDLAGDGRMLLVPTPGHTRGHMALVVRSNQGGFFCCGDVAKTSAAMARVSPVIDDFFQREQLIILACHDPTATAQIQMAR